MKIVHREWTINSVPKQKGHLWHAWVEVKCRPCEDDMVVHIYHFTDIGYYESESGAVARGVEWAKPGSTRTSEALAC